VSPGYLRPGTIARVHPAVHELVGRRGSVVPGWEAATDAGVDPATTATDRRRHRGVGQRGVGHGRQYASALQGMPRHTVKNDLKLGLA